MAHSTARLLLLSGLFLTSSALTGCQSAGGFAFRSFGFGGRDRENGVSENYANARKTLDKPKETFLAYARWKEDVGELSEARRTYDDVLADQPDNLDALLGLARIEQLAGRTDEAEQRFHDVYEKFPNNARAMHAFGQFYAEQKRWDESIAMLRSASLAAPDQAAYRYRLGEALARADRMDEAIQEFTRSVGAAEAKYNVGYILHEQGRDDEAERYFMQALAQKPTLRQAEQMLAGIRSQRAQEFEIAAAERRLRQSGSSGPNPVVSTNPQQSIGQQVAGLAARQAGPPVRQVSQEQAVPEGQQFARPRGTWRSNQWQTPSAMTTVTAPPPTDSDPGAANAVARYPDQNTQTTTAAPAPANQAGLTPQQLEQMRNQTEVSAQGL